MLKKTILLCIAFASAGHTMAQAVPEPPDMTLPRLPRAADLSTADIGQHFLLRQGPDQSEQVFFIGTAASGPLALSATDVPSNRMTYENAMAHCLAKGPGWRMPTIHELRIASPFADEPEPDYLPGGYWTITNAPCFDCKNPDQYKMAYDIRSGNVRNALTGPIFRFYPACVFDIP